MTNKNINTPTNMLKRTVFGVAVLALVVGFFLIRQISDNTIFLFDVFVGFLMIAGSFEIDSLFKKLKRPIFSVVLSLYPVVNFIVLLISIIFSYSIIIFLLLNVLILLVLFLLMFLIAILNKRENIKEMYFVGYEGSRFTFGLKKSANTVLAMLYPTFLLMFLFCINHFQAFMSIKNFDAGFVGLILLFATTMTADTCAFCIGRLFKSKKLSLEKLGPGKTYSGLIGGILGAILAAIIVYIIFVNCGYRDIFTSYNLNLWSFLFAGLFCGIFNMSGDILASFLKRRAGVKDFSNLIPGHGGVMDRINGLIVNSVVVFIIMLICF